MDIINILYDLIKSYHIFKRFDPDRASEILATINDYRLQIALLASAREIFIEQLPVPSSASGYKQDVFLVHDDIECTLSKGIAFLVNGATATLTKQGSRETVFTRQPVNWQHLFSDVQDSLAAFLGQQIPFNFPQDIHLKKSEALNFGITGQTSAGLIFAHGANILDQPQNYDEILKEIAEVDINGDPVLPIMQIVPIQFQFTSATTNSPATAYDGGSEIYSLKTDRSVILTHVSVDDINFKATIIDKGRNQTICDTTEILGIAGRTGSEYDSYYPLPYPHFLPAQDRLQLKGFNGSVITGNPATLNTPHTLAFKGFTI